MGYLDQTALWYQIADVTRTRYDPYYSEREFNLSVTDYSHRIFLGLGRYLFIGFAKAKPAGSSIGYMIRVQEGIHGQRTNCKIYVLRDLPCRRCKCRIVKFAKDDAYDMTFSIKYGASAIPRLNRDADLKLSDIIADPA